MDPNFGLLNKLFSCQILSKRAMRTINDNTNLILEDKNKMLIKYILEAKKPEYVEEFVRALKDTGQSHLANYLEVNGNYNPNFGDDWPLPEIKINLLTINHSRLIDILDLNHGLCNELIAQRVINSNQYELISSKSTNLEKNYAFLDMLDRCSLLQFNKTINCLHSSHQSHVAQILSEGGVVLAVHANLEVEESADVGIDEAEDEIARRTSDLLAGKSTEEANHLRQVLDEVFTSMSNLLIDRPPNEAVRLLELVECKLIAVQKGESVVLYFICKTVEELTFLSDNVRNGHLKIFIQRVFRQFLPVVLVTKFDFSCDEYNRYTLYFSARLSKEKCAKQSTLNDLPLEILDVILLKVYLTSALIRNDELSTKRRCNSDIIFCFASVDECFFRRIFRLRFKKRFFRYLSEFYRKSRSVDPAKLFSENLKLESLICGLRSTDCLTDIETRFISALTHDRDAKDELLNVIRSHDDKRRLAFYGYWRYCLYYTRDPAVTKIIRSKAAEEENKEIKGIAIIDNEVFVVTEESFVVDVFDSEKNYELIRSFEVKELVDPLDMVSCRLNNCIYISDWCGRAQPKHIYRVDVDGKMIKKWSTGNGSGRLSVTSESNVIFTVYEENKLIEYSPDGEFIREINLDESILHPHHAVKLSSGNFVVCHGSSFHRDLLHRVCLVDTNGVCIKSFGGDRGSSMEQLDRPEHLTVDKQYGFVFVVDRGNSRVMLLSDDLNFTKEFISKEKLNERRPFMMTLNELNDRLFVVDNDGSGDGRILIFDIRQNFK